MRLLGCHVDPKFTMQPHIDHLVQIARPKIKALLRTRGMYDHAGLLHQYKTHIWSLTEHHSGSIRHATETVLSKLDRLQTSFLRDIHLTVEVAFMDYNFAPACLRRDIGLLGFLHKRVLGLCHPALLQFLPMDTRSGWHDRPLKAFDDLSIQFHHLFHRSLFGMIHVYNRLPQYIVEMSSVRLFQKELTNIARQRCSNGIPDWPLNFP